MSATRKQRSSDRIGVGDRVRFPFGASTATALVIEDRGDLGVGGRQIIRVRMQLAEVPEPLEFETAADDVTVVRRAS